MAAESGTRGVTRLLPNEAATFVGCGYDKLMQMVRAGQIPHYRIGRRVFFTKEKLSLWIDNQERQSLNQPDQEVVRGVLQG